MLPKIYFYLLLIVSIISCNQFKKKQDPIDIIASAGERQVKIYRKLDGKWSGVYESTTYEPDTVFYKNYEEKLDYLLTGEVKDSSLVKEIKIKHIPNYDSILLDVRISKKYLKDPDGISPK